MLFTTCIEDQGLFWQEIGDLSFWKFSIKEDDLVGRLFIYLCVGADRS
jgi:hypothetical protein